VNEFIEQFLIEGRELVDQATSDLLALEQTPGDKDRLDSAFRAFHTLKGAAGIIDFDAMARALHAAEDALAAVRGGSAPVTPKLISDALGAIDQVLQWLHMIEATEAPPADAEAAADAVIARFNRVPDARFGAASAPTTSLDAILEQFPQARRDARTAMLFRPDTDSFFKGEDPLAVVEALPGLLALSLTPSVPWPALETLDPFACRLVIAALFSVPRDRLVAALGPHAARMEFIDISTPGGEEFHGEDNIALRVLEAQILMLLAANKDGLIGRLASAARVARNVLRRLNRTDALTNLERAHTQAADASDPTPLIDVLRSILTAQAPEVDSPTIIDAAPAAQEQGVRSLRVDVERIDALVRLTGELTVLKNAVGHIAGLADDGADSKRLAARLKDTHAAFDRLTTELQHSVLAIRVLPLRQVFQRFPRLVRELGLSLGKSVRFVTEGDDTEADKAIVESLFEPLLHVLRNAIDHGLEHAQARAAKGKPEIGEIVLRGARRGEHVLIEVEDDGGGVDVVRVRQVAEARGVAAAETLAAMTEAEVADLVFAPGFSTADAVTDISGRGVGMDAVRIAVERMGGRATLESRPGLGTMVRFVLPFTVMMTRVLTVQAGEQMFGIPLDAVLETVRRPRTAIHPVGAAEAFVLRGHTVPLLSLAATLGPTGGSNGENRSPEATVVVTRIADQTVGLEVDRLGERLDVMLKPMDGLLSGMTGVSGTTLLGDGRVLIVLDLQDLVS
jgi:two-component system chemotaxis sensor kinase CheA